MNLKINIDQSRDLGLDLVRAIALILMINVHFVKLIPAIGIIPEIIILFGEAAPVFFFFAFGITLDLFLKKNFDVKIIKIVLFFFVALSHNIYTCYFWNFKHGTVIITEFLFFLWLWQLIILIIESHNKKSNFFYTSLVIIILFAVTIIKPDTLESVFQNIIKGPFALIPWGVFVISGLVFNRSELLKKQKNTIIISLFIIFTIIHFYKVNILSGISLTNITKWPLSISFIIIFGPLPFIVIIIFNNKFIKLKMHRLTFLIKGIQFLSKNLLLATVSHYLIYLLPFKIHPFIYKPEFINKHPIRMMISGSILIVIMLFIILFIILKIWSFIKTLYLLRLLRRHFFFFATFILFSCTLPYGYYKYLEIHNSQIIEIMRTIMIYVMIYFTLEMNELKNKKLIKGII